MHPGATRQCKARQRAALGRSTCPQPCTRRPNHRCARRGLRANLPASHLPLPVVQGGRVQAAKLTATLQLHACLHALLVTSQPPRTVAPEAPLQTELSELAEVLQQPTGVPVRRDTPCLWWDGVAAPSTRGDVSRPATAAAIRQLERPGTWLVACCRRRRRLHASFSCPRPTPEQPPCNQQPANAAPRRPGPTTCRRASQIRPRARNTPASRLASAGQGRACGSAGRAAPLHPLATPRRQLHSVRCPCSQCC
mmetsp:Transcript_47875/g.152760  ORF Transcript_47875/g.152760 Transcript_47875/m.152760 type:complete len:252 (+) Transcript_47875:119-874(+)